MNKILTLGLIGGAIYLLTRKAEAKKEDAKKLVAFIPDATASAANKILAASGGGGFTTNNNAPSTVVIPNPGGGNIIVDTRSISDPLGYDGSGIMAGQGLDLVRNTGAMIMDNGMMADIGMRPIEEQEQYNRPCMVDQNTCFA